MGFDYANEAKERYPIVKWDIIFNILILAFGLWYSGHWYLKILAALVFIQAYVASYYIFHYHNYWIPLVLVSIAVVFWVAYPLVAIIVGNEAREAFLFTCGATTVYALFSFVIRKKNHKLWEIANRPPVCPLCGEEKEEHVWHYGQDMCVQCFEKMATNILPYHDEFMYQWDFDILSFLEETLDTPIPQLDTVLNYMKPSEIDPDALFGYVIENKNITRLYLNHQKLEELPPFIGLAMYMTELHIKDNKLVRLPASLKDLINLRVLDYRQNPLEFRSGDVERALLSLTRRGCKILEDQSMY